MTKLYLVENETPELAGPDGFAKDRRVFPYCYVQAASEQEAAAIAAALPGGYPIDGTLRAVELAEDEIGEFPIAEWQLR